MLQQYWLIQQCHKCLQTLSDPWPSKFTLHKISFIFKRDCLSQAIFSLSASGSRMSPLRFYVPIPVHWVLERYFTASWITIVQYADMLSLWTINFMNATHYD